MKDKFYDVVSPKVSFFCAPDWLINNEPKIEWFTVEKVRKVLEENGSEIVWHNTSPNKFNFK